MLAQSLSTLYCPSGGIGRLKIGRTVGPIEGAVRRRGAARLWPVVADRSAPERRPCPCRRDAAGSHPRHRRGGGGATCSALSLSPRETCCSTSAAAAGGHVISRPGHSPVNGVGTLKTIRKNVKGTVPPRLPIVKRCAGSGLRLRGCVPTPVATPTPSTY